MSAAPQPAAPCPTFSVRLRDIDSDTLAVFARYDVRIEVKRRPVAVAAPDGLAVEAEETATADVPGREFAPLLADLMNAESALLVSLGVDPSGGGAHVDVICRGAEADLAFAALRRLHGSRMDVIEVPAGVGD